MGRKVLPDITVSGGAICSEVAASMSSVLSPSVSLSRPRMVSTGPAASTGWLKDLSGTDSEVLTFKSYMCIVTSTLAHNEDVVVAPVCSCVTDVLTVEIGLVCNPDTPATSDICDV